MPTRIPGGGTYAGRRYLSEASLAEMTRRQTDESIKESYGLGWAAGQGTFGHGGALATNMLIDTNRGLITIFLVIVGASDNALKPLVMGRGLPVPVLVIFIGVIGGTLAHGIVGLFIGPIVLAVAWELMMAWINGAEGEQPS